MLRHDSKLQFSSCVQRLTGERKRLWASLHYNRKEVCDFRNHDGHWERVIVKREFEFEDRPQTSAAAGMPQLFSIQRRSAPGRSAGQAPITIHTNARHSSSLAIRTAQRSRMCNHASSTCSASLRDA